MFDYKTILHPKEEIGLHEVLSRVSALESSDQKYALRGGSAVTYDSGGRIANLNASYINAGSIDASEISVTNINASNIGTGTLSANRIGANSIKGGKIDSDEIDARHIKTDAITASKIDVENLAAINADLGTITAGTITGALIRTGSGGDRVQLDNSNDDVRFYNSGTLKAIIDATSSNLTVSGQSGAGVQIGTTGTVYIGNNISLGGPTKTNGNQIDTEGGRILMGDAQIREIDALLFEDTSSNKSDSDWMIWAYNSTEKGFRCRVNGSLYQFDLTSK